MLEKFLACMSVLKIQICSGKIRKGREKQMVENRYEIRTDLPSARACRFASDERDLSPALVTTVTFVLENWTKTRDLTPHLLCMSSLGSCGRRS